jgi:hypothetical protein
MTPVGLGVLTTVAPGSRQELRSFGLLVGGAFCAIAAYLAWRSHSGLASPAAIACLAAGAPLVGLGAAAPLVLRPVHRIWMGLAHVLGAITTHIILSVFFFIVLAPFALVRFKDPLRLRTGLDSYWERTKLSASTLERFRRPF